MILELVKKSLWESLDSHLENWWRFILRIVRIARLIFFETFGCELTTYICELIHVLKHRQTSFETLHWVCVKNISKKCWVDKNRTHYLRGMTLFQGSGLSKGKPSILLFFDFGNNKLDINRWGLKSDRFLFNYKSVWSVEPGVHLIKYVVFTK